MQISESSLWSSLPLSASPSKSVDLACTAPQPLLSMIWQGWVVTTGITRATEITTAIAGVLRSWPRRNGVHGKPQSIKFVFGTLTMEWLNKSWCCPVVMSLAVMSLNRAHLGGWCTLTSQHSFQIAGSSAWMSKMSKKDDCIFTWSHPYSMLTRHEKRCLSGGQDCRNASFHREIRWQTTAHFAQHSTLTILAWPLPLLQCLTCKREE